MQYLKLIIEIFEKINEAFIMTINYFNSPNKRIFYLYIITSIILALFVFFNKKRKVSFKKYFFNKRIWLSKSAFTDYGLLFFNSLIKIVLIAPLLIFSLKLAFYTKEYILDTFGYHSFTLSKSTIIIIYTITVFLVNDFFSYLLHLLQHKIPFLWRFHKVHHSATSLNPITQYRIHPVELYINNIKSLILTGLLIGIFDYIADGRISVYTLLGVNVFNFVFMLFGANLRHSQVKLKYPDFLENILISPFQHQVHHSNNVKHFDKNMGSKLAIWDCLFGTLIKSKQVDKLEYGLGEEDKDYDNFFKNLINPLLFWK